MRAAFNTLPTVALPDEKANGFGNRLARNSLQALHVFERFYLSPYSLVMTLCAKHVVLYQQYFRFLVTKTFRVCRFDPNNLVTIDPKTEVDPKI